MDILDALKTRFTCRAFAPKPLDRAIILKVVEAALQAPSWGNTQPWEVFIASGESANRLRQAYKDRFANDVPPNPDLSRPQPKDWPPLLKERYESLRNARSDFLGLDRNNEKDMHGLMAGNFCFFDAPAVIFLCMDRNLTHWSLFDLGAFSQSIMLSACEYGLGTAVAVQLASYPEPGPSGIGYPGKLICMHRDCYGLCRSFQPSERL